MRGYSEDLRKRIVDTVLAGTSSRKVAEQFKVSWSSVKRYVRQYKEEGHLCEKAKPGRPAIMAKEDCEALRGYVVEQADATVEEYRQRLADERGVKVSATTVQRMLIKLGLTRKKDPAKQRA